jgi:biopolymer transport protein ExbD
LFGYDYTAPELKGLRDLFRNIRVAYLFRLGADGTKATNDYATALYNGLRGNDLKVVIAENADDDTKMDVSLYLDAVLVDRQTVLTAAELADNAFVTWDKTATLTETAGTPLTGGMSPTITNADFQTYLDTIEGYAFNAIGCPSNDSAVKGLFAAFTRRLRDEQGVKFQLVNYDNAADYEGVVNVMNAVTDVDADVFSLIYWTTGVDARTAVNASATKTRYDGEFTPNVNYTQIQLENAIKAGKFAFHRVGDNVRVLVDVNSLVTVTADKNEDFKQNQTIRVIDQIANDIAVLFNTKYLGVIPNDQAGRISLWADVVLHHEQLQDIRAIQDFSDQNVTVNQGNTRRAVVINDVVRPVNAMEQLYMTCVID